MAAGERSRGQFGSEERARLERAVARAEEVTGLQLCVYLGPPKGDPRAHAEGLLREAGAHSRPAVMLYVAPAARRVEVVVAEHAVSRISDSAAQDAVHDMLPRFAADDLVGGLEVGLDRLAAAAGPGTGDGSPEELPDVLE